MVNKVDLGLAEKRIRTTMVGAVAALEETMGHLWADEEERELTAAESELFNLYEIVRSKIFDIGNAQIRNIRKDVFKETVVLPVRNLGEYND